METKKNFIILGIIFIFVIGFGGWYIYRDYVKSRAFDNSISAPSGGAEEQANEGQSSVISDSKNSEEIKKQMPDLDGEIVVKGDVSEENKNTALKKIKEIIARLKEDYDQREEWLNLGIWRKSIGDYEGAKEAWEFVTLIRPNDPVAFHNLGDLYSQYLIDFPQAEKYYLAAIAKDPKTSFYYVKLYEFYRYFVKKPDSAENILVQGVKATGDSSLKNILEDYRKEIGK